MPGPGDAGPSAPLPHPPLPASLTRPLRALLHPSRAVWASNPARLRWRGRDFVFCRAEIGGALRRACARPPPDRPPPAAGSAGSAGSAAEDAFADVVATVLQQGHLLPVAPGGGAGGGGGGAAPPVWWGADCGLWLHPPPHGLVLMDRGAGQAACAFGGVACCSPGSFGGQGAFAVLRPAGPTFELSALP